ncbi:unnamed protein product [Penicillium salamii]|nr:unnamed protein product [Penicillium salamii]CAG8256283.1 unnamed protein product [Penicillium salamii]CAG8391472.1 unnamed protein product [Penicillium salamii]
MRSATTGCWTCRVRHRKCDLEKPSCKECTERDVRCHGYGPKPVWMNGGPEEQKERSRIKATINKNFRRVKKLQHLARQRERESNTLHDVQRQDEIPDAVASPAYSPQLASLTSQHEDLEVTVDSEPQSVTPVSDRACEPRLDSSPRRTGGDGGIDNQEACLLMHYLDQVFPWQYPYHDSRSRLGNRGWLFLLLIKRGPLYHAILSLSSLHQGALLDAKEDILKKQKALNHHSRALRELCDMMSEKGDKLRDDHAQLADFLTCSFMLISFEVFCGAEHDWIPHLDAVTSVMTELSPEEIFKPQTYDDTNKRSGTNADLEFLMVGVMWYDLLACVSTGSVPRLPYQSWLQTPHLDTADLMGCENWVMLAIGDLAYLSAWKGQQEKDGLLSIRELASKGIEIETRLENGIKSLDQEEVGDAKMEGVRSWVSHLFALAALVLLHTIVSGPLPVLPEIRNVVSRSIAVLETRPKTCPLTGSVWALCIIACMAQPHQPFFERLMGQLMRESGRFGNTATVQKIITKCWEMQETGRADCRIAMSEMGIHALLI